MKVEICKEEVKLEKKDQRRHRAEQYKVCAASCPLLFVSSIKGGIRGVSRLRQFVESDMGTEERSQFWPIREKWI